MDYPSLVLTTTESLLVMRPSKCKDLLRFYGPVQKTLRNLNSLSPLTWPFTCLYLSLTKPGLFSQPLNLFVETRRGLEILVENMPVIFYASLQSFISPYDLACQTCFSNVNHLIFEVGPCFRKKNEEESMMSKIR